MKRKLTADSVAFIRRSLREGVSLARLAAVFGVSRSAVLRQIIEHPRKHIPLGDQSAG